MDDFLCVVENESTEEDETSVESQGVDTSSQSRGRREEVASDAWHEDHAEALEKHTSLAW